MKTSEIVVGGTYSNGKGRVRKVIAEGCFRNFDWQRDKDWVKYEFIEYGPNWTCWDAHNGNVRTMTRNAFARWAKARLE